MGRMDEQVKAAQERIKREREVAEEERKRELLKRRISIANEGVRFFEAGKWVEANKQFQTYLGVLEHWKKVPSGGLHPNLFDRKLDITELLLISGVYWDLVKLYDRNKNAEKDFNHFCEKYIQFSVGMPFQPLCAEAVRRYINKGKCVRKDAFKRVYQRMAKSKCFVATSLVDLLDEETIPRLVRFRDAKLLETRGGRNFIAFYYRVSPRLVRALEKNPRLRPYAARALDLIARNLR